MFSQGQVPVSASFFSAEATYGEALGQFICPFERGPQSCLNYQFDINCYLPFVENVDNPMVDFGLIIICHLLHSVLIV